MLVTSTRSIGVLFSPPPPDLVGDGRDALKHVISTDKFTEGCVLLVEELGVTVADEELAAGRVRARRAGHRDDAAHMRLGIELGLHLVAGIARAGDALGSGLGVRAAALHHEALDDPVKGRAIIETLAGQPLEIFNSLRRDVAPEGEREVAVACADDRVLFDGRSAH